MKIKTILTVILILCMGFNGFAESNQVTVDVNVRFWIEFNFQLNRADVCTAQTIYHWVKYFCNIAQKIDSIFDASTIANAFEYKY